MFEALKIILMASVALVLTIMVRSYFENQSSKSLEQSEEDLKKRNHGKLLK